MQDLLLTCIMTHFAQGALLISSHCTAVAAALSAIALSLNTFDPFALLDDATGKEEASIILVVGNWSTEKTLQVQSDMGKSCFLHCPQ